MLIKLPEIQFCFSFKVIPSCQTLSHSLDICRKIFLASTTSSKVFELLPMKYLSNLAKNNHFKKFSANR